MPVSNFLLHHALETTAKLYAEKTAVIINTDSYSFQKLDEMSENFGSFIQANGFKSGDRAIVCLGNQIETIVAFWGVLKAGGVICNISLDTSSSNFHYILDNSQATLLVTTVNKFEESSSEKFKFLSMALLLNGLIDHPIVSAWETALTFKECAIQTIKSIDIDLAAIIYTSGSTGMPKGVMLTHRNMCAALASLNTYLDYKDFDNVLCPLPLSFDYGLYQMIMCMSRGATLVLEQEFTWPIFLIKKIQRYKITIIPFVPTMLMLLHEYAYRHGITFSHVRIVTNTGAALKPQHISQMKSLFPQAAIFSMYGLTECKRCTYVPPEQLDNKPGSVGIAIPNTELWLVDDDGTRIEEPNHTGQLVIRGSTVMAGYWRNIKATTERLRPGLIPNEMVLYTGDLCSLDEDGYLYFQGRMDHVIKSRGIKVSPNEVEDYLYSIQGVEAASVIGLEHDDIGGILWAFVVISGDNTLNELELLQQCRLDLEPHQVPHSIRIMDSLPRTPNGKFNILHMKLIAEQELNSDKSTTVVLDGLSTISNMH